MIYYFTGTGNSEFVATTLANLLSEGLRFIPDFKLSGDTPEIERMILIFPVYSWGVPPLISEFIGSIPSSHWNQMKERQFTVDCVMICGDEVGLAPEMLTKILKKTGMDLNSVWSVIMPNNYVLLPGFDVDSKEIENKKLEECKGRILEMAQGLTRGDRRIDVVRGSWPKLKTGLVFPLFKKWGIFPKKWHYTPNCISCGKCSTVCPMCNVKMKDGHPEWGSRCCSCLACYHVCPVHSVEYGKATKKKGQYFFPLRKISSHRYCR